MLDKEFENHRLLFYVEYMGNEEETYLEFIYEGGRPSASLYISIFIY